MKILKSFIGYIKALKKSSFVEVILAILVGLLCVIVFLQVFSRYLLNFSLAWTEELSRFILIWVILLGGAIGIKRHSNFAIDIITNKFSKKIREKLEFFLNIILFIIIFDVFFLKGIHLSIMTYDQLTPALHIRMSWIYSALVVSGALSCCYILEDIFFLLSERPNNKELKKGDTQK